MVLGRQIYSLLKRHTAVFVNGLGTFRRIRTSASFDAKRNVVLPPLSYIEFEHDVAEGYDFILYIQQTYQLEKFEAESFLQEQVDKITDLIKADGQVTLDELGQFVSYGHSFIFKPFDLSGFQFLPLEDPYATKAHATMSSENAEQDLATTGEEKIVPVEVGVEEDIPVNSSIANIDNEEQNLQDNSEVYYEEEPQKRGNGMVYALVGLLAILIMGGVFYYLITSKKLDIADNNIALLDSLESEEDTLVNYVDTTNILPDSTQLMLNDSLTNDVEVIEEPSVAEPVLHKFTIVIGTHKKFEQAEAEAAEYQRRGFKHVQALPSNLEKNRKKVIWDTYPTKELRDSALRYVRKNIMADAWGTELN